MSQTPIEASGKIAGCATSGCGFACCDFQQGNFIVLPPGELEEAKARGQSLGHLELSPLPYGGWRAVCHASDTASCDQGYKPMDCRSYPFFPTVDESGRLSIGLKGAKCPLEIAKIESHRLWVAQLWRQWIQRSPVIARWLSKVRLIGYEPVSK